MSESLVTVSLSLAAGTDGTAYIGFAGQRVTLLNLRIVPRAAITADGTDYITLTAKKGSTTLATLTTDSGEAAGASWVAGTEIDCDVSETVFNGAASTPEKLSIAVVNGGSGKLVNLDVTAHVRFERAV